MRKLAIYMASILVGLSLVGCSSNSKYSESDCAYFTDLSNQMAELAYQADLSGDVERYKYYKESYDNIMDDLPEMCS